MVSLHSYITLGDDEVARSRTGGVATLGYKLHGLNDNLKIHPSLDLERVKRDIKQKRQTLNIPTNEFILDNLAFHPLKVYNRLTIGLEKQNALE